MSELKEAGKPRQPAYERVRSDHARETAEDYTELILDLAAGDEQCVRQSELVKRLGVSHVTVVRTVARLERDGLVERVRGHGVRLTGRGRAMAEGSRRRHELVVAFLRRIGVPEEIAAADAEGIEHHVSNVTLERMCTMLEDPPPSK